MNREFHDNMDLLCRKGFYPYEWVDHIDKLEYEGIPPQKCFYSGLRQEGASDVDYKHALHVFETMRRTKFKGYHNIYIYIAWCAVAG